MKKNILLLFITSIGIASAAIGQTDSFDVFLYQAPPLFSKSEMASEVQFNLTNKGGSFCTIALYKSLPAKADILKDAVSHWNEQVVKRLTAATKKPIQTLTGKNWDGWKTALSIGNFFRNKKKCVVMLYTFSNGNITACAVYTFSDKTYKGSIEFFSENLHLIIQ